MAKDDWFRNTHWNEQVKAAFFAKLSRARSQRDQYLVIQALMLSSDFPQATHELVDLYFETRKEEYEDVRALLAKADAYKSMNDLPAAIESYKQVLEREAEFPSHKTMTSIELPYLIALKAISSEYKYAWNLLATSKEDIMFPVDGFKWNAASAIIARSQSKNSLAIEHATKAIEIGKVKKSGFRYHQNVGLVGKEHQQVLKKLVTIAN